VYRGLTAALFDRDAALDALHDAFVEGLRRPPPHDVNLEGWLFRVALRKARRSLRRRSVSEVPLDWARAQEASTVDRSLARLEVGQLLMLLTERQRAIVIAHFYLGLRHDEVAQALGIRPGTVGATISQALQRMRRGTDHVV
jgi:RNA polymerase sigma-70 factor (ECF subfamily)